jgi:hypothetical protein
MRQNTNADIPCIAYAQPINYAVPLADALPLGLVISLPVRHFLFRNSIRVSAAQCRLFT